MTFAYRDRDPLTVRPAVYDLPLCQNPVRILPSKSFVYRERSRLLQPCPETLDCETSAAISARRAARRFRLYSSVAHQLNPNARPSASLLRRAIRALHLRQVNRVLCTVPSGRAIGLPLQIEQLIVCGMTSLRTENSPKSTSEIKSGRRVVSTPPVVVIVPG